jgi:hypothetical protein
LSGWSRIRRTGRSGIDTVREHRVFAALFAAGVLLRLVTFLAYRPALLYQDSIWYLDNAEHLVPMDRKPAGYSAFLRLLGAGDDLALAPLANHLMALAAALLVYALLLRLGVRRWVAALATAPLLLDAFQLLVEQHVLSEALFELLLAGACAALLWRRPLGAPEAALAGLLLALAVLTRVVALVLIVPALVAALAAHGRPSRPVVALALLGAFAAPLAGYALWYHAQFGAYGLTGAGGRFLYARVAPFAECDRYPVPADERPLCPLLPVDERPTPQEFAWSPKSPWYRVPDVARREALGSSFAERVIREQPLDYARAVAGDVVHGFAFKRSTPGRRVSFAQTWSFQDGYPQPERFDPVIRAHGGSGGTAQPELSAFLRGYQEVAFTPGPLLALGLLAGLAAAVRGATNRGAAFLLASIGLLLALAPAATHMISPRYVLPALVVLPPALAVGLGALRRPAKTP